jgi:transcriptional regulator with XRE-family HTH domain
MPEDLHAVRLRVGRHVRRLRRARGFTQERLAELVGNTWKHIGQIERGEVNVGLDILTKVAASLEVDVSDLVVPLPRKRRSHSFFLFMSERDVEHLEQIARNARAGRAGTRHGDAD